MVLRYDHLSSQFKLDIVGNVALSSGAAEVTVIDLTAAPFKHGFHRLMLAIQNVTLTGDLTINVRGNTAADGSGTDTDIREIVLDSADANLTVEIPNELIGHYADRAGTRFKSIVIDASGTGTDDFDAAVLTEAMQRQEGLTPSDTTTEAVT